MNVCLDIDFTNEIVCILGGGQVALRKAKQFVEAGSKVYLYSLTYHPEFDQIPVIRMDQETFDTCLPQAKLFIACTNDSLFNQTYIKKAKSFHVLTMSCHPNEEADAHAMMTLRKDSLVLACSTSSTFPLMNQRIIQTWQEQLHVYQTLRTQLHDKSLSKICMQLSLDRLQFLMHALKTKKAIVYLLHGSATLSAQKQCFDLTDNASQRFSDYSITTFFLSKKYYEISLSDFCALLKDLQIQTHFVFLFWQEGQYVKTAKEILKNTPFSFQHILIDPHIFIHEKETLIMHTKDHSSTPNSVVVSMLDSQFLKETHLQSRFVACLDHISIIERITHETNPIY